MSKTVFEDDCVVIKSTTNDGLSCQWCPKDSTALTPQNDSYMKSKLCEYIGSTFPNAWVVTEDECCHLRHRGIVKFCVIKKSAQGDFCANWVLK